MGEKYNDCNKEVDRRRGCLLKVVRQLILLRTLGNIVI